MSENLNYSLVPKNDIYLCKINDTISVAENSKNLVKKSLERLNSTTIPVHLNLNTEKLTAIVNNAVPRDLVGLQINELLVVEYYSRKV